MDEQIFFDMLNGLSEYLKKDKLFIQNPARIADVQRAYELARDLFPEAEEISVVDDPLQTGALSISIRDYEMFVRGTRDVALFNELIKNADNFEFVPYGDGEVKFSLLFTDALIRIG